LNHFIGTSWGHRIVEMWKLLHGILIFVFNASDGKINKPEITLLINQYTQQLAASACMYLYSKY